MQFSCNKTEIAPDVSIKINPPIARAGEDQILNIPFSNSTWLDGSRSTGDPLDPLVGFTWRVINSAGIGYMASTSSSFQIRHNYPGQYLYELMVTSKTGLTAMDTLMVIANYDTLCNASRIDIPASLKELTSLTGMEYPVLCKVSNKIALVASLQKAESVATKIMLYDLDNGTLESQILENGRKNVGVAALDDKIYLAGGTANETYSSSVDIYDTKTKTWTIEHLSQSRSHCAAVAAEGEIMFAGGYSEIHGSSDRIDIYNPINKNWKTVKLSEPRTEIFPQYADGKVYFIGGRNSTGISSSVDVYDCLSGTMSSFKLPSRRYGFSSVVHQGKLYVAGGMYMTDNENFDIAMDVQIVDLATNSFSFSCLSRPKSWLTNTQGAVRNNKIVFPFQQSKYSDPFSENTMEIFDPASGNWEKAELFGNDFITVSGIGGKTYALLQKLNSNPPYYNETKLMEVEY